MKTISFKNAHGSVVQHEIASTLYRSLAFIIDIVSYYIFIIIIAAIWTQIFRETEYLTIIISIIFIFIPLLIEILSNGQSLGKMALGLCVVSINGKHCTMTEYFTRFVVKLVEIFMSFGLLPVTMISFSKYGQSLGDKFAGTTVIVKKKNARFSLKEIAEIQTQKDFQIDYPLVKRMHEKDILMLKTLLQEQGNIVQSEVLRIAANKIKALLKIDNCPYQDKELINKIITEYIILTR